MDKHTLAASIRIGMFAERETIQEAFDYADQVFKSLGAADIAARTAMHVVLNTVAKQIAALPDPLAAPAEEIRIETVQLSVDRATLDDIIDARIAQSPLLGDRIDHMIDTAINSGLIDVKIESALDDFADNRLDEAVQKCIDNSVDWTEIVRDELINNISFSINVD
jgi:hypothetical protein